MNAGKIGRKLTIGVPILITILIIVQVRKSDRIALPNIETLPKFHVIDKYGRKAGNEILRNRYVFIQNVSFNSELDALKKIFYEWENENIVFLVIGNEETIRVWDAMPEYTNIYLIDEVQNQGIAALFNRDRGLYYLFDLSGRLVMRGKSNTTMVSDTNRSLNKIIRNKYFKISDLFGHDKNIPLTEWFSQISDTVKIESREFYLIGLFNSLCQGCNSGSLIRYFNRIHKDADNRIGVLCLIDDSFAIEDIPAIKSQLGMEYPLKVADAALLKKWKSLAKEFSSAEMNEIIIVLDSKGRLLKTMDSNCSQCAGQLFDFVNKKLGNMPE